MSPQYHGSVGSVPSASPRVTRSSTSTDRLPCASVAGLVGPASQADQATDILQKPSIPVIRLFGSAPARRDHAGEPPVGIPRTKPLVSLASNVTQPVRVSP